METTRLTFGSVPKLGQFYDAYKDQLVENSSILTYFDPKYEKVALNVLYPKDIYIEIIQENSFNEKLMKLNVDNDQKTSILSGQIKPVKGPEEILTYNKENFSDRTVTLFYRLINKKQIINLQELEEPTNNALGSIPNNVTHIVTEIEYGFQIAITFSWDDDSLDKDLRNTLRELHDYVNRLRKTILSPKMPVELNPKFAIKSRLVTPSISSFIPYSDLRDLFTRIEKLPTMTGQAEPIRITLIPINTISKLLSTRIFVPIDVFNLNNFLTLCDNYMQGEVLLNDRKEYLEKYKKYIEPREIEKIADFIENRKNEWEVLQGKLREQIERSRRGHLKFENLEETEKIYSHSRRLLEEREAFLNSQEPTLNKIHFILEMEKHGGKYYQRKIHTYDQILIEVKQAKTGAYLFHCNWNHEDVTLKIYLDIFYRACHAREGLCIIYEDKSSNRISYYDTKGLVYTDIVRDYITWVSTPLAYSDYYQKVMEKERPIGLVQLKVKCPKSYTSSCQPTEHDWLCNRCLLSIEYDPKGFIYCNCGKAKLASLKYKCSDENHGQSFVEYNSSMLTALSESLRQIQEINILVLGESGAGKSTWINSIANYMSFETLDDAMKGKPVLLLPVNFKFNNQDVCMGQSENENFQSGQSSTQEPRTYTIRMGNKLIRLIDTPGIGDTRGIEADMQNIAKICEYLSAYKKLHGICILSKAANNKLTSFFKFCLNELLTQLNKSAIENFVFCFTFASRDALDDVNSQELLQKYFHQLRTDRRVFIELNEENTYFLENKAFRFLCAYHSGVTTSKQTLDNYRKSWELAVEETYNLFKHVSQLKPHNLQDTISLNASRQMILALKQPILSIFLNLETNIKHFEKLKKMINESKDVSKIVMEKLETEDVNLEHGKMKCFSESCNGKVCHEICDTTNGTEPKGSKKLQYCQNFRRAKIFYKVHCKVCGCSFKEHMHVKTERKEKFVRMESFRTLPASDEKKEKIDFLNKMIEIYGGELKFIDDSYAKLGRFLKKNSIMGYNQSLEEYIDTEIQVEMASKDIRGEKNYRLKRLNELKNQLKNEGDLLEQAMEQEASYEDKEIFYLKDKLLSLKMSGKYIEKAYENIVKQKLLYAQKHETVFDAKINGLIEEFAKNIILEMKERRPDKKMDSFVQEMDKKQVIKHDIKENQHGLTKVSNGQSSEESKLEQKSEPEQEPEDPKPSDIPEEITESKPQQSTEKPIAPPRKPRNWEDLPMQVEDLPTQVEDLSMQVEDLSTQVEDLPTQVEDLPTQVRVLPTQVGVLPMQETMNNLLRNERRTPALDRFRKLYEQNHNVSNDETTDS